MRWRFAEGDRSAVARFEPVSRALSRGRRAGSAARRSGSFPDAATKAPVTGSSRPGGRRRARRASIVRVEIDASSPAEPDLVTPVLAAAGLRVGGPALARVRRLLLALGARALGRWWGRDVPGFAAFAARAAARREASRGERAVRGSGDETTSRPSSPSAAPRRGSRPASAPKESRRSGAPRAGGDAAGDLERALGRWAAAASLRPVDPPVRRPMPAGFLRGVSYAMSNSIEAGYASPRSRETLARLARLKANSVSVMPFAFQGEAGRPDLFFVHRSPRGETDEGTVRAVENARSLGMTAMIKPQIWVGNDVFVGKIAMRSEEDWKRWFELYRRFVVHHAIVAEAAGAALYCVGTELAATELRVADWRETIAAVRLATGAPLTYAANWAGGAVRVPFWDDLDAIGVDFYDPPSGDPGASDAALEAGAARPRGPSGALARSDRQAGPLHGGRLSARARGMDLTARREQRTSRFRGGLRAGDRRGVPRPREGAVVEGGLLVEGVLVRPRGPAGRARIQRSRRRNRTGGRGWFRAARAERERSR